MSDGALQVRVLLRGIFAPVQGALVRVFSSGTEEQLAELSSDAQGQTQVLLLPAPPFSYAQEYGAPRPFAEYDVIDAYYKAEKHRVDYNNGNYVVDSIYERKYLDGTDQYATFLNSNQSTTVISGSGTGKCLILKDSYANCFAQFCVDDFVETHLIDMRFFRGSVQEYIEENGITEVLVLYNIPNFTSDTGIIRCGK